MSETAPRPTNSDQEVLAGLVERVTFHSPDSGFCVLRTKARGHRDLITVVGHAAMVAAGEWITASGDWVNDRTHGQQFKARFLRCSAPSSTEGMEKYLASGTIRGIGPVYARKLVRAFGERVFDVIEEEPGRLREVDGIGPVRAKRITEAWAEQKVVREIMVFLHSHGVGTPRVVRIFKTYGVDAVQVMTENPYRLARDIRGIGFTTADAIAMKLGIEKTAMIRVRAGIAYTLSEAMDDGHCGLPQAELLPMAADMLEAPEDLVRTALDLEQVDGAVVAAAVAGTPCLFLAGLYRAERVIAEHILQILRPAGRRRNVDGGRHADAGAAQGGVRQGRPAARGRRRPAAVGRSGPGTGRHHRLRRGSRGASDRSLPPGGAQPHRGQRAPHQPGRHSRPVEARRRQRLLFRDGRGCGNGRYANRRPGENPHPAALRTPPGPRYPGAVPHDLRRRRLARSTSTCRRRSTPPATARSSVSAGPSRPGTR